MITKDYIILDPNGMHARPATALIKLSRQFKSAFCLKKDGMQIQMRSMLNILSLAAKGGDTITLIIEGEDETEAEKAFDNFFFEEIKKF
jgi:phosphocarrier protein